MITRKALLAAALATPILFASSPASAQAAESWNWRASIYAYLPDIGGTTTFPQTAAGSNVTVDSSTIVDSLKFAFMGSIEAHRGRWGWFTDVIYMDLGNTKSDYRQFSIGGVTLPAGANANVSYDLRGWAWTLGGTWRVAADPASTHDLIVGARLFDLKQTLGWEVTGNVGSIPVPSRTGESRAGISNWDAIVGVKGRFAFGEGRKWFAPYYLDVGAGDSDLTWQAMGGIGYSFQWGDVVAAWRYLDYEMKSGSRIADMNFNGPAIAAVFRW